MTEHLNSDQAKSATVSSKIFEKFWRSIAHPEDFSVSEKEDLNEFVDRQIPNFKSALELEGYTVDNDVLIKVFMGLFHYPGVKLPSREDRSYINN